MMRRAAPALGLRLRRTALLIAGFALALPGSARADPLLMAFRDKPPYSYVDRGVQKGFLLERVRQIMAEARVETVFRDLPPKRIFADLEGNAIRMCSFGWYKIPEREKFARFSQPIHQDRPHVILAGARSADRILTLKSLRALMADTALVLGVVDGVSYGTQIDAMIDAYRGPLERSLVAPLQLVRKLAANRFDFMFIDQEDFDFMLQSNPEIRKEKLARLDFNDMPAGLKRYILCSQQVSDDVMARINQAIARSIRP